MPKTTGESIDFCEVLFVVNNIESNGTFFEFSDDGVQDECTWLEKVKTNNFKAWIE